MSSVNVDFKILRNQVGDEYTDKELKILFQKNNYNIVSTLLEIENYVPEPKPEPKNEAIAKIAELREIANEKDKIIGYIRDNFSETTS